MKKITSIIIMLFVFGCFGCKDYTPNPKIISNHALSVMTFGEWMQDLIDWINGMMDASRRRGGGGM